MSPRCARRPRPLGGPNGGPPHGPPQAAHGGPPRSLLRPIWIPPSPRSRDRGSLSVFDVTRYIVTAHVRTTTSSEGRPTRLPCGAMGRRERERIRTWAERLV